MPKIPRDISGQKLAQLLFQYGYNIDWQKGSHIRLTTKHNNLEHHITIPNHDFIKIGTLNNILSDVASFMNMDKKDLIDKLFS